MLLQTTEVQDQQFDFPSILSDVKLNLVKAHRLDLSLKETVAFGMIQRLIELEAVGFSDIDDVRWWHIDSKIIAACDPNDHAAGHPFTAEKRLEALDAAGVIEIHEIEHAIPRRVLRIRTDIVIWE